VLQALAAATLPVKMAAGRRLLLLLAASLGTRACKQVYLCVSDGGFMVHASTGHGRMRAADCCCKAYGPYRTMATGLDGWTLAAWEQQPGNGHVQ
jgi:hypothetical protein